MTSRKFSYFEPAAAAAAAPAADAAAAPAAGAAAPAAGAAAPAAGAAAPAAGAAAAGAAPAAGANGPVLMEGWLRISSQDFKACTYCRTSQKILRSTQRKTEEKLKS